MRHHGNCRPRGDRENTLRQALHAMRRGRHDEFGRRGFGRHGRHDGEGGGGRGRRRMFESGELRLVLLLLMKSEPRHGYDLIREIETRTGGSYSPSPGIIYPTLTLLEEMGQVEERAVEGARKLYAITDAGLAFLTENERDAEAALARLEQLRRRGEALDSGPVHRAMSNLRAALQQRLANKPDKQLIFSVADAIDEAARKIERL